MASFPDEDVQLDGMTGHVAAVLSARDHRVCPVCDRDGQTVLFSDAKVDHAQLDAFAFASRKTPEFMHHRLVRCLRCDVVFADPAPTADALDQAYFEAAFDSVSESRYASRTYGRALDRLLDRLPSRNGALDIGTGDGSFLHELQNRNFTDIGGIEPSAAPIAAADAQVRSLIHHGPFLPDVREPGSLSLVTCFQTIEHLHDPLTFCTQAAALLRPGGALLLVAHNRRAVSARVLREKSPIYDVEHLQLFSPRSARTLMRRAGLAEVSARLIVNRYPVTYWLRLSPLPRGTKETVIRAISDSRLGSLTVPVPAGNMAVVGFRPGLR
jgi:SAM-dependent methyltransferase